MLGFLVEAVERIVELKDENARLKQQLEKALDGLSIGGMPTCPSAIGLGSQINCLKTDVECGACWRKALEEVE
ncbi:Hypothetical protein DPCES_2276 [Desulfitobacterium hafniense]|uniref:Uncharacterized protein n=1 Tax=Desulfitobacterium hafniense TaxID=49338 RepID=A0A098B012_DESHA|nr:hypothetical protein [Desulfitobacterium hafniense]CDX02163.1 Hypothetical protein DPCES_2276 [Desulfitobacterium hafniense]